MAGKKVRFGRVLFLGILVSSLGLGLTANAEGGNIGGKPANPDAKKPRTSTIFIKTVEPGESAEDGVEVINNTDAEKVIQIYSVDSVRSSGGAFACAQASEAKKDVGAWVKLEEDEVKLLAGQKKVVKFNVNAPLGADVGEHNGCIVLQEKADPEFQEGIALNFRTAIRVAVLIPGDIIKELNGSGISVASKKKTVEVKAKVKSKSNVSLDAEIDVRLEGILFGSKQAQSNTFPVLSKEESEWNFEFKKPFWGGFYKAGFGVSYNGDTNAVLGEETSSTNLKRVEGPTKVVFLWPHPYALGIELLVLILLVTIIGYTPKKIIEKKKIKSLWQSYTVKKGDTLEGIAEPRNIGWKKLAKVNKIKAPYVLVEGSELKVPPIDEDGNSQPGSETKNDPNEFEQTSAAADSVDTKSKEEPDPVNEEPTTQTETGTRPAQDTRPKDDLSQDR